MTPYYYFYHLLFVYQGSGSGAIRHQVSTQTAFGASTMLPLRGRPLAGSLAHRLVKQTIKEFIIYNRNVTGVALERMALLL
jgi:hypothetical protein